MKINPVCQSIICIVRFIALFPWQLNTPTHSYHWNVQKIMTKCELISYIFTHHGISIVLPVFQLLKQTNKKSFRDFTVMRIRCKMCFNCHDNLHDRYTTSFHCFIFIIKFNCIYFLTKACFCEILLYKYWHFLSLWCFVPSVFCHCMVINMKYHPLMKRCKYEVS